jgi:nucleoside-diphosphate-sugar epimerase
MRILIIGASSFLAGHLRRAAALAGHTVLTAGRSDGWSLRLDLATDPERAGALIASVVPDVVVNCAGATAGSADVLAAANITAVHTLVTALLVTGPPSTGRPAPRLVHLGSAAEYGLATEDVPVTEDAVPHPGGLYGATKLGGTRLVELARTAGLDAVVLRVFNVVGAGSPKDTLPGTAVAQLRHGGGLKLGPLDAVRDFVDARDVADAVLAAAAAPALPHGLVNIGSGAGVQARALIQRLLAVAGLDVPVHEDAPGSARSAGLAGRRADVSWADISRADADLRWRPRRDLTESLRDLWEAPP